MKKPKPILMLSVSLCILLCLPLALSADVSPGDRIDQANWGKLEGLVPDPVLNWVKKGDFVLHIHELEYPPRDYFPQFAKDAFQANVGKYDLDEDDGIIDRETTKRPAHIVGLPFPEIDQGEPKAAKKIMYNALYMQYILGDLRFPLQSIYIGHSGFQREIDLSGSRQRWSAILEPEKGRIRSMSRYTTLLVRSPFDLKGTAIMLWRYLDPTMQDSSFGFIPAIRRVRRMSPANRSDALLGSDFSVDDANGYDGKITDFEWKLLGTQEMIAPVLSTETVRIVKNEEGEWETTRSIPAVVYGHQKEGWQGAPWAPTNLAWVSDLPTSWR